MTSIGFIKDKNGKQYEVKYSTRKQLHGRQRYDVFIFDGERKAGEVELDTYDGEGHAEIDTTTLFEDYRGLEIYSTLLPLLRDFFKSQGYLGILSMGNLRNAMSDKAWNKVPGKKVVPKKYNMKNASPYEDYVLERKDMVTSITDFKKLNEDRQQQIIPFEEPEFQKLSIHAHLQDAFNDLSVMRPDVYYSHGVLQDKIDKVINKAFNFILLEGDGDDETVLMEYVWQFARAYDPIDDSQMYSKKFIKYALSEEEDSLEDLYKFSEIAAKEPNIKTVFSMSTCVCIPDSIYVGLLSYFSMMSCTVHEDNLVFILPSIIVAFGSCSNILFIASLLMIQVFFNSLSSMVSDFIFIILLSSRILWYIPCANAMACNFGISKSLIFDNPSGSIVSLIIFSTWSAASQNLSALRNEYIMSVARFPITNPINNDNVNLTDLKSMSVLNTSVLTNHDKSP